jgi:inosine/xanthosine triphosphatase
MIVVVASNNPVKARAVLRAFKQVFPDEGVQIQTVSVPSGVTDQPLSMDETIRGADTRALNAMQNQPGADYYVGIEGGVENTGSELRAFAWVVVRNSARCGRGSTGCFSVPPAVADLIRQGKELGEADDIVFGRNNSKQGNGAVGLLTHNLIDREAFYTPAVVLALIPFIHPELYPPCA